MIAKFTTGTPGCVDYKLSILTIRYKDRKDLYKKLRLYCDDMYETRRRELKLINDIIPGVLIFQFCGVDVRFNKIRNY